MSCVVKSVDAAVKFVVNTHNVTEKEVAQLTNLINQIDKDFLKSRHATQDCELMFKRFSEGCLDKAIHHSKRLAKKCVAYANDYPFNVGDDVYVIRYEHGWMNGDMKAKVIERTQNSGGVWIYVAMVYDEDGKNFVKDYKITIEHTRDACLV